MNSRTDSSTVPSGGPATPAESTGTAKKLRPARTNATRQKLFEASMDLIGERGVAGVTVDEIAAAAGVSKGTVYYNFGSKSDLIAQLLRHGVDILLARLLSVRADSADPLAAMEKYESTAEVMQMLEKLPENQKEAITLKFGHGLSYKEIAEITGHSVSNVGVLIHTGLKAMRARLVTI